MTIQDIRWNAHLEEGEDALFPAARKKLGILKHLGKYLPTKSRKLLCEGLVLSKIRYLLPIWGGTTIKHLTNGQTLLNDAARFVLGEKRKTHKYKNSHE